MNWKLYNEKTLIKVDVCSPKILEDKAEMVVVIESSVHLQVVHPIFLIGFVQLSQHLQLPDACLAPEDTLSFHY